MTMAGKARAFLRAAQQSLRLDRRWQIAAACAAVILLGSTAAFGPIVRSVAQSRAAARGLELEIGAVRPGWFTIWLKNTRVRLAGVSAVSIQVEALGVELTPWSGVEAVMVQGGEVVLAGTLEEIRDQIERWRASRPHSTDDDASPTLRSGPDLHVEKVSLVWTGLDGTNAEQVFSGIHAEHSAEHTRAGFESAKLESAWGQLRAKDAVIELAPGAAVSGKRSLTLGSANVSELVGRITLPEAKEAPEAVDPAALAAASLPPVPAIELPAKQRKLPKKKPKASPHSSPKSAQSPEPSQRVSRWLEPRGALSWPERKALLEKLRELLGRVIAEGSSVDVERMQIEIARGASVLNVGPAPLHFDRKGSELNAAFTSPPEKDGKRLTVTGRFPLTEAPIELSVEGGPISLQTLGVHEGDFGLLGTSRSALTLATRVELSTEGALWVSASGQLHELALEQPALAPEPLRDMDLNWGGQVRLDLGERKLEVKDGSLGLERVRVYVEGAIAAAANDIQISFSVQVPATPCQDLLEAAPHALLPMLDGLRLGGSFALDSRVEFDSAAPKDAKVEWNFDNKCKVLETPEAVDPRRFREPFQHFVQDAEGRATEISTGPSTDQWVPLSDITPNMETALIVCEDSRFFSHDGFDNKAIRDSIIDNLRAGHFVRGASTLSMQLAKNLYLGREKTLSRKLQEAALTLLLEERLSKEDILELYLNVVEFGPGVYGIRNAASHYFNSHPGELSLAQALYLGSVLPSPKANHFEHDGALRPGWAEHLRYLMRIARKINRISDDELEAGLSEQLMFGQAHPSSDGDFLFGTPLFQQSDG